MKICFFSHLSSSLLFYSGSIINHDICDFNSSDVQIECQMESETENGICSISSLIFDHSVYSCFCPQGLLQTQQNHFTCQFMWWGFINGGEKSSQVRPGRAHKNMTLFSDHVIMVHSWCRLWSTQDPCQHHSAPDDFQTTRATMSDSGLFFLFGKTSPKIQSWNLVWTDLFEMSYTVSTQWMWNWNIQLVVRAMNSKSQKNQWTSKVLHYNTQFR